MIAKDNFPFNTMPWAAEKDVRAVESQLAKAREATPDSWRAFKIAKYWDGGITVAVVPPSGFHSETVVHAFIDGSPQMNGQVVSAVAAPFVIFKDVEQLQLEFDGKSVVVPLEAIS